MLCPEAAWVAVVLGEAGLLWVLVLHELTATTAAAAATRAAILRG